ncbi:MAG: hypothetical protein ACI87A_000108 [Planctomycetota bacterium]|jgi:hypothetical protein
MTRKWLQLERASVATSFAEAESGRNHLLLNHLNLTGSGTLSATTWPDDSFSVYSGKRNQQPRRTNNSEFVPGKPISDTRLLGGATNCLFKVTETEFTKYY